MSVALQAKAGGTDPTSNVALAAVLQQAKNAGVPKDIVSRNIAKAADKSQADFSEVSSTLSAAQQHSCKSLACAALPT